MPRFLAALMLLYATLCIAHVPPASAQQAVPVFAGMPCLKQLRTTSTEHQGRVTMTYTGQTYSNDCGVPVRLLLCHSPSPEPDSCTAAQYTLFTLASGERRFSRGVAGLYPHVMTACGEQEELVDWKSIRGTTSQAICRNHPIPASADPGYRGEGTIPNLSAPAAQLLRPERLGMDDHYPSDLKDMLIEGVTTVSIAVGIDGRATGCAIEQTSGYRAFDAATCDVLMRRGRFAPAKDAAGDPVESVYAKRKFVWAIR